MKLFLHMIGDDGDDNRDSINENSRNIYRILFLASLTFVAIPLIFNLW